MAEKESTAPWVWIFLILILGLFIAFIVFLDQKIVSRGNTSQVESAPEPRKDKPTIDFYSVLPDRKVDIPITDLEREAIDNPAVNKESGDKVILQVGSFQSAKDADSLKAQLAFLGLEAKIKSVEVNSDNWHRVQLGPYGSGGELSRTINLLLANNIKYMQRRVVQ